MEMEIKKFSEEELYDIHPHEIINIKTLKVRTIELHNHVKMIKNNNYEILKVDCSTPDKGFSIIYYV